MRPMEWIRRVRRAIWQIDTLRRDWARTMDNSVEGMSDWERSIWALPKHEPGVEHDEIDRAWIAGRLSVWRAVADAAGFDDEDLQQWRDNHTGGDHHDH